MENFQVVSKESGTVYYSPATYERCVQYISDRAVSSVLKIVPVMDTKTFRVMDVSTGYVVVSPFTKGQAIEDCKTRNDAMKAPSATWTVIELAQVFA